MLACFPTPLPGETVFSMCARFARRMDFPSRRGFLREVFGLESIYVHPGALPTHLAALVDRLLPGSGVSVESLIEEHSVFPFYAPFLAPQRRAAASRQMRLGGIGKPLALEVMTAGRSEPQLRYCPIHVRDDRQQHGEGYWHRHHQLPGVLVCADHRVHLETIPRSVWGTSPRHPFIAVDDVVAQVPEPRALDPLAGCDLVLVRLAAEARWLVDAGAGLMSTQVELRARYSAVLSQIGMASPGGALKRQRLVDALMRRFCPQLLDRIGTPLDAVVPWVCRTAQVGHAHQHPLHHLMLISTMGLTVDDFFGSGISGPAKSGPWPCFNAAADHYGQRVITSVLVRRRWWDGSPRTVGTFTCDCGYVYSSTLWPGSVPLPDGPGRVLAFGSRWEARLNELWADESLSLASIAHALGVTDVTVVRHAQRLALAPRSGVKPWPRKADRGSGTQVAPSGTPADCESWMDLMRAHPLASRSELKALASALYRRLRRHESAWLEEHLPPRRPHPVRRWGRVPPVAEK